MIVPIFDAAMRHYSLMLILLLAAAMSCGCQSLTSGVMRSFNTAAADYHRVTTGSESSYIASKGQSVVK
jgi:hypothetical protein